MGRPKESHIEYLLHYFAGDIACIRPALTAETYASIVGSLAGHPVTWSALSLGACDPLL